MTANRLNNKVPSDNGYNLEVTIDTDSDEERLAMAVDAFMAYDRQESELRKRLRKMQVELRMLAEMHRFVSRQRHLAEICVNSCQSSQSKKSQSKKSQ